MSEINAFDRLRLQHERTLFWLHGWRRPDGSPGGTLLESWPEPRVSGSRPKMGGVFAHTFTQPFTRPDPRSQKAPISGAFCMGRVGIEPTTLRLRVSCSA
jgi:hypothetical protein